jgi:hypothetical protein
VFNSSLIRRRRLELGFGVRALGAKAAVGPATIRGIEANEAGTYLDVAALIRLAEALALGVEELLVRPAPTMPTAPNDAAALGAVLARSETVVSAGAAADILGWTLDRVEAAADVLQDQLPAVGFRLHRRHGGYAVRPGVAPLGDKELAAVVRHHFANEDLDAAEVRLLWKVLDGLSNRALSYRENIDLARLLNAEIVEHVPNGRRWSHKVRFTDDVVASLGLDRQR